jgi:glucosamine kinase
MTTDFTISGLKIGVDGGGTKTEFILVDSTGTVIARHVSGGGNPSHVGTDRARDILRTGLAALLLESKIEHPESRIGSTHLYMAGSTITWREIAAGLSGFGTVVVEPDSLPVLELATAGAPGLVLHAGTGSFVAARARDGTLHYAGGLGWKLGDPGSGFDLGRRAIAVALLELQARAHAGASELSPLAVALRTHTGLESYADHSRFFYNDPGANSAISGFAPRVLELAEQGYVPAQQVVSDSMTDLAQLADGVIHRLFSAGAEQRAANPAPVSTVPCGISGKILNSVTAIAALRSLAIQLHWPVDLVFISEPPSEGVRRLLTKSN